MSAVHGGERIVVTATGIISALGRGWKAHAEQIFASSGGLVHPRILHTKHAKDFVVGEVPLSNQQLLAGAGSGSSAEGYSRTSLLSVCALQDMLQTAEPEWLRSVKLAFINATTVGGMSEIESLYSGFISPERRPEDDVWMDALDCADCTERAIRFFGIAPEQMATISTACSSSANALIVGARMLQHGLADAVIAGGSDALSRFTLNGFTPSKMWIMNHAGRSMSTATASISVKARLTC